MPGGDRTGPMGAGPMTGRAAGFCAGYPTAGYMNSSAGRGRGFWGRGGGRGFRRFFAGFGNSEPVLQQPTAAQELENLKRQAQFMQNDLSQINDRIEQLEKENAK